MTLWAISPMRGNFKKNWKNAGWRADRAADRISGEFTMNVMICVTRPAGPAGVKKLGLSSSIGFSGLILCRHFFN